MGVDTINIPPLPLLQDDGLPLCQGCGACCIVPWADGMQDHLSVALTQKDVDRLPAHFVGRLNEDRQHGKWQFGLKTKSTSPYGVHCIAWNPETRECTIYETRPEKCVDFDRGNTFCQYALEQIKKVV